MDARQVGRSQESRVAREVVVGIVVTAPCAEKAFAKVELLRIQLDLLSVPRVSDEHGSAATRPKARTRLPHDPRVSACLDRVVHAARADVEHVVRALDSVAPVSIA